MDEIQDIELLTKEDHIKLKEAHQIVLDLEIQMGTNLAELTGTLGRLGEFYALEILGGYLPKGCNQEGWDFIKKDGTKVSVKTTASKVNGTFARFNANTSNLSDESIVIFYDVDKKTFEVIYHETTKQMHEDFNFRNLGTYDGYAKTLGALKNMRKKYGVRNSISKVKEKPKDIFDEILSGV